MIIRSMIFGAFLSLSTVPTMAADNGTPTDNIAAVLDMNDAAARWTLLSKVNDGDLTNARSSGAWVVIAGIAQSQGLVACHFFKPDDLTFMWRPATTALSEEEIYTLNRIATANYRMAEKPNGALQAEKLFPIVRQSANLLLTGAGKNQLPVSPAAVPVRWDCKAIQAVWEAANIWTKAHPKGHESASR